MAIFGGIDRFGGVLKNMSKLLVLLCAYYLKNDLQFIYFILASQERYKNNKKFLKTFKVYLLPFLNDLC